VIKRGPAHTLPTMVNKLLSTGQAAKALGISGSSLSRWVRRGLVTPTLKTPGGQYRFDLDDLKAQMDYVRAREADEG
jgi:excisionase family DNA binding protein